MATSFMTYTTLFALMLLDDLTRDSNSNCDINRDIG